MAVGKSVHFDIKGYFCISFTPLIGFTAPSMIQLKDKNIPVTLESFATAEDVEV